MIPQTTNILVASKAIIVAHKVNYFMLWLAKKKGCYIIHRLDEHFQENETGDRKKKHDLIIRINRLADVTVFQSEFVKNNVEPILKARKWTVIRNGSDPSIFADRGGERKYVGHVTNSVGDKKRLDLLEQAIVSYPDEMFLLVGNHAKSHIEFKKYPNVILNDLVQKYELSQFYQKMKCLYFPSENDPCPNTAVEAILSGVPVCYNELGGTVELVKNCGLPLREFDTLLQRCDFFRKNCANRQDLYFDTVAEKYLSL